MSFRPIYEGWDIPGKLSRSVRQRFAGIGLNRDAQMANRLIGELQLKLSDKSFDTGAGQRVFAEAIADNALANLVSGKPDEKLRDHLADMLQELFAWEGWFAVPVVEALPEMARSELWELEDHLKRVGTIVDHLDEVGQLAAGFAITLLEPVLAQMPQLAGKRKGNDASIAFEIGMADLLENKAEIIEHMLQVPFAPDFESLQLLSRTRERLEYNLHLASGGVPGNAASVRTPKLPTKNSAIADAKLIETYLGGTPLADLFDYSIDIELPQATRFEHMHMVAGSGHGKTQTLQHFILRDLEAVAAGDASIIVIDSQSDLINTIAGLEMFAPGNELADRLVLIDPTDIEYPVALNLFDVGRERLDQYSKLERERLTNSILELYDFVLGSLLDAGMTQKQTVIFRYITRLLLHIPNATIHTLRELLEDDGYEQYKPFIDKLQGSAKAFFEQEFNGPEFRSTKRQVLRRLYGILENQTFERMFSHPKSKLDLFTEMNEGKVILINTAKDLLKENGTEIFGRFFIAMIAQAAQERATLDQEDRLPTFVYIDEANDYFDRNIGIILSQARKYNVGMVLAHQYLGQLEPKLHEAISANTSIKFAGGVSAKDARALANDLRTDAAFIEKQLKLSFAAFIKGQASRAVSLSIEAGQMEAMERIDEDEKEELRDIMRERYAVHYTDLNREPESEDGEEAPDIDDEDLSDEDDDEPDTGEPMKWE